MGGELKRKSRQAEKQYGKQFEKISRLIFKNPEVGGEEYKSAKLIVDYLESHGFHVVFPYGKQETAFRAEFGKKEGPTIAFLAEYDALPGYGPNGEPGHACGHNWIAATTIGACVVLSKLGDEIKGKIVLLGTPGEENTNGKIELVEEQAFDNIDICMQPHLENINNINCKTLAMNALKIGFRGRPAHAAVNPYDGINALDGVNLTFNGINAMRQHLRADARIHGIITRGGEAPNIIPDYAECKFYVRTLDRAYLDKITKKVIDCARGAEMMTGAKSQVDFTEKTINNLINNRRLQEICQANMRAEGFKPLEEVQNNNWGSSDIGNVSQVCPTLYMEIALEANKAFKLHSVEALELVDSDYAYKKMHQTINVLTSTAIDLYEDEDLVYQVKKEHEKKVKTSKNIEGRNKNE